ncbi:MAG: hypothetical protein ACI9JM_002619 [Halioglobus sp.]|jgi:hypothetical protein
MDKTLADIEAQITKKRDFDSPPLHLWDPPLSGDISIRITADGTWFHDGSKIEREALVRMFASILRREDDGEYYLLTPVEKWRIEVELHPLMVTDVETVAHEKGELLRVTLNTAKQFNIGPEHPLFLEPIVGGIAAVELPHGLSALFTRAAWYRLVGMADDGAGNACVHSGAYSFSLESS